MAIEILYLERWSLKLPNGDFLKGGKGVLCASDSSPAMMLATSLADRPESEGVRRLIIYGTPFFAEIDEERQRRFAELIQQGMTRSDAQEAVDAARSEQPQDHAVQDR